MNIPYLTALSALAGSVFGGLTTGITTWLSIRSQARGATAAGNWCGVKTFLMISSAQHQKHTVKHCSSPSQKIQDLIALHALVSRLRVLCLQEIVARAEKAITATIDTCYMPNRTVREVNDMTKSGTVIDPPRDFSEAARDKLGVKTFAGGPVGVTDPR